MGGIGKTEFQSDEDLLFAVEPFIDPTKDAGQGAQIYSGDTCTFYYIKPDASTGNVAGVRNANGQWEASIAVGSYMQGRWSVKAVSSDGSAPFDQHRVYHWGTGAVEAVKAIDDRLPSDPADESQLEAAIAGLSVDLTPVLNAIADARGADNRDLTEVYDAVTAGGVDLSPVLDAVEVVRQILGNDWVLDPINNKILVYDNAGYLGGAGTVAYAWDTKDSSGNATTARIFRRLVGSPP